MSNKNIYKCLYIYLYNLSGRGSVESLIVEKKFGVKISLEAVIGITITDLCALEYLSSICIVGMIELRYRASL